MPMKCSKAQDLYFASRDDVIDEPGRMALARHLAECPSCARFVSEMDAALDAARQLPELSAPEGFEWNVKRLIMQEKSKLMRSRSAALPFGDRRWLSRFTVGAAAAAAVVVLAAVFAVQRMGTPEPRVKGIARASGEAPAELQIPAADEGVIADYSMGAYAAGPRMVSDNIFTMGRAGEGAPPSPFQSVSLSREDSLTRENEALKRRVAGLERQIMLLNGMLDRERMQRLEMSLP
jgi:hypothetical protein